MTRKSPAFATAVIATLALTIGLCTTVFSVLDAVLVRPLPYNDAGRIVSLKTYSPQGYTQPASYPEYRDWRRDLHSFSALAGYSAYGSANVEIGSSAVALHRVSSTDNFFEVFGVKPAFGRTFVRGEEDLGRNRVAVLSFEVWQSMFGGRKDALNQKIKLDGYPYTVIGVMPAGFRFPISQKNAIYTPLDVDKKVRENQGSHWLPTVARLRPDVSAAVAQQEMTRLLDSMGKAHPEYKGRRVTLVDLQSFTVGSASSALRLLIYAVAVLLAIGCVNISGLLLARGIRMEREAAIRTVLGASRVDLVRQLLVENVLYGVIGAAAGVALAFGLLRVTSVLLISALERGSEVQINGFVLVESVIVAIVTALLSGLIPAVRLSKTSTNLALRSGGRFGSERTHHRLRSGFVITQIALALVLLLTAGLLFRTLAGLRYANFGFEPSHILTVQIDLSKGRYENHDPVADFYTPLLERVSALPGVQSAGLIQLVPIMNWGWNSDIHIVGTPPNPPHEERLAEYRMMTAGSYGVFGNRLLRGRLLDDKLDNVKSQRVAVVNETFVKRFIPAGQDPLGKVIEGEDATIVGVVTDIRQSIYDPPLAETDYAISQMPPEMRASYLANMQLVVRTAGKPEALTASLRRVFADIDSTVPFHTPETMNQVIADALLFEQLENWLFGTFAGLAVLLALVGLYGLISQEVESSRREIGVRIALGATRMRILRLVYSKVGAMLVCGLAAGFFVTWLVQKVIATVVTIEPHRDAPVIAGVACFFAVVVAIAAFMPARRAVRLDPMESLRME